MEKYAATILAQSASTLTQGMRIGAKSEGIIFNYYPGK